MRNAGLSEQGLHPLSPVDRISFPNIFSWAHAVLSARWGLLALTALVIVIYNFIASIVTVVIDGVIFGTDMTQYFSPTNFVHSLLITAPLGVGPIYMAAKIFRGEPAGFEDFFIGFQRWLPVVLVSLLIQIAVLTMGAGFGIVTAAVGITSGGGGSVLLMVAIAAILFAVMMLYFGVRIYFATLLIVDPIGPRAGTIESLQISWEITSRNSWTLFWTAIVISVIAGLSFLLLIIPGILYGMPLVYAASGAVYVILTHEHGIVPLGGYDQCPHCLYNLIDTEGTICPECGNTVPRRTEEPASPYHPVHNRNADTPPADEPPIPLA